MFDYDSNFPRPEEALFANDRAGYPARPLPGDCPSRYVGTGDGGNFRKQLLLSLRAVVNFGVRPRIGRVRPDGPAAPPPG